MSNQGKNRKGLIVGVVAAVAVLVVLLVVLLTQCTGGDTGTTTAPSTTETVGVVETYDLYWNMDRKLYDGMSEAGMSSRMPEDDGYFHVRFFKDGEVVTLRVADRKVVNALEVMDLMGLVFDDNGIIVGVLSLDEMPCEQVAWQFYVQSAGGKLIKCNSSASLNGMEVMLECTDQTGVWDMTGMSGEVGCDATPIPYDRLMAVANSAGEVTHVFLYERTNYMRTHEAECEHCGKVVEWSEWTKETSIPNMTGHFQLMNDITTTGQTSMPEDAKICLDLNGKRIDGKANARVYSLHNPGTELAIMDTSEAKNGTIAAHGKGDQGMCVWLRYGVFYLYDGILDGSDATTTKNGTTVALQGSTYMYMNGGEIIGGTSTYLKQDNGKYTSGLGGSMSVATKAKFVLNDGVIRDGFAQAIVTKRDAKGEPSTYERGYGGNIFLSSGSVMEMNGGTIKNGKAGNAGGNIYMDGTAEFTMKAGTISGGSISGKGKNGGSIYVSTKATFTMNGGSVIGGSSRNCAGNLYLNGKVVMNGGYIGGGKIINWTTGKVVPDAASRNVFIVNGNFSMYGGTIDGGVQAIDTDATKTETRVTLSGYATITSETTSNLNISTSGGGVKVVVGTLRDRAKIGVNTSAGLFSQPTKEENLDNFYSDVEGAEVVYYQERLGLGRISCMCGEETHMPGCDGELLFWAPWTSTNSLPTTTGNYYLLKDVKCNQQNVTADADVKLDLNGHRVDGNSGTRIYSMHYRVENVAEDGTTTYEYPAHLTVTDTSEKHNGVMASHGNAIHNGSIFWLRYGDVTILAGTFDASDFKLHTDWTAGADGIYGTSDDGQNSKHGGAVSVPSGRTFTMYGGTIIGGEAATLELTKTNTIPAPEGAPEGTEPTTEEVKKTVTGGRGGSIDLSGKMYMYGGTITGGVSTGNGGNIYMAKSSALYMYGGTIKDGWSKNVSGNIHLDGGTLTMSGGTITGGKTGSGGTTTSENANIFSVNGKMNLSGGTITGHVRVSNYNTDGAVGGSEVRISGNPVIYGGTVNMILAPQDDKTASRGNDDGKTPTMPVIRVVGPMTEGANIHVNPATGGIDFAVGENYTVTAADGKAFTMQGFNVKAAADTANNALFFGRYGCLCGKSEHTLGCKSVNGSEQLKWYAWNSKTTLPTTGNIYLTAGVTGSGSTTVKSGTTLNLDLNGQTVSWKYRAYRIYDASAVANATLTLTNTAENEGSIKSQTFSGVDQGVAVWLAAGEKATFNLLDGVVLDGSGYTISNVPSESNGAGSTAEKNGGVVAVQTGDTFNMYGGTIIGANAVRSAEITLSNGTKYSSWAPNGAAVAVVSGNAYMYGGTITGGTTANQGGNLLISGGKFYMSGGTISDGYATSNGGNVFVHRTGELHMSGDARIEGGESAGHSGNINLDGKMTMTESSVVTGGVAKGAAGNININVITSGGQTYYGSLTMSGKASVTDGEAATNSGNIRMLKGTSMTMTGEAVVSGGNAKGGQGGNISIGDPDASLTMSGKATVKDGTATTNGGNIAISSASTFTATDEAVISGGLVLGTAGTEVTGGNLAVTGSGAVATLSGSAKVLDGKSYHTGGNIRVSTGATLIVKDDVLIDGGKSSNSKSDTTKSLNDTNGNANIFCVNGNMELYGGTITGNVNMIRTSNSGGVKIAGDPVITKGASGYGLYSSASGASVTPAQIQVTGAMTGEPASVVVGISTGTGIIGSGNGYTITDADAAVFVSDRKGSAADCWILRENNNLVVGKGECLCGQETHTKACLELWNGENRVWIAWNSTTALPTTTGNYYLTADVDFDWQQKIVKDANVVLDLNGHTVTNDNGQRIYATWESGSSLTITDKSEGQNGKFIASGTAEDQGILWARYGTINLVGGTIDGANFNFSCVWDTTNKKATGRDGGVVSVSGGATFNMYGGTIIGAKGVHKTQTVDGVEQDLGNPRGGAVAVSGTFNMYSGEIRDGQTSGAGGNIYIASAGKMFIYEGAKVTGGVSGGAAGNILVEGQLTLDGGIIENGTSGQNGGNVRVTGTVTMKSGLISGGWGKNVTGNIHVDGANFIMTGGEIKGGKVGASASTTTTDANINSVNGKVQLLGGTVDGGVLIQNYNKDNANVCSTKIGGDVQINKNLTITHSDGKAQPQLEITSDFTGSLKVYVKSDGIITTGPVTEAQAAKITTANSNKNIYRITDQLGFPAEDVGKLYIGQIHCVCGASETGGSHYSDICDGSLHVWQPTASIIDSDDKGADQYYYLTNDVTVSAITTLWGSQHNVTYDLSGHKITVTVGRIISTYSSAGDCKLPMTFTITNTGNVLSEGNIIVKNAGDEGRIAWLRGSQKTVNIYNANINISAATNKSDLTSAKSGIAIAVNGWSNTANLYKVNAVGGTSAYNGNFLGVSGYNNKATVKDSKVTGCSTAQTEKDFGGNGGAFFVGDQATLTLADTEVTGNVAKLNGGGVYVLANGKLILSGNTKITGNTVNGVENNVYVADGATIVTGSLGSNAQVGLSAANGVILSTDVTYSEMEQAFKADDATNQQLVCMADGMSLQDASAHIHCVCGGTLSDGEKLADGTYHYCTDLLYTAANFTSTRDIKANCNWYLTDSATLVTQHWVYADMNLCLNGKNLTGKTNNRMLATWDGATITLTTCAKTETVDGVENNRMIAVSDANNSIQDGGCFWLSNGTVKMYAGTLDASGYTLKPDDNASKHGCAVYIPAKGTFIMYNGAIRGGKTVAGASGNSEGPAVLMWGKMTMLDGTISGGYTVGNGGNLYVGGTFDMYGGTISSGKADKTGGNIFVEGTFNMHGGLVENGSVLNNGKYDNFNSYSNIALKAGSVMNMTGGTVRGSMNAKDGVATLNVSGDAKICRADGNLVGNNIWVNSNTVVNIGDLNSGAGIGFIRTSAYTDELVIAKYTGTGALDLEQLGIYMYAHKDDNDVKFALKLNENNEIVLYKVTETEP